MMPARVSPCVWRSVVMAVALVCLWPTDATALGVSMAPSLSQPRPVGTAITWTATPIDPQGEVEYLWWIAAPGGSWNVVQDWTPNANTLPWTPGYAGTYHVSVWVRHSGNSVEEGTAYTTFVVGTPPTPVSSVTLAPDLASPRVTGTTITWTATPTGGATPVQYRWYLHTGGGWSLLQDWTTSNTRAWTPTAANPNYKMGVWARAPGSTADPGEAFAEVPYVITAAPPAAPANPTPATGATGVAPTDSIAWGAASGATGYDIAFGTTSSPPLVSSNSSATSYAPTLAANTTYYWQVTARNAAGTTAGPVWSFTTGAAPPFVVIVSDTFSGASGTSLPSHAPDVNTTGGGWQVTREDAEVLRWENRAALYTGSGHVDATIVTNTANVHVAADLTLGPASPTAGLTFRMADADNNLLLLLYQGRLNFYQKIGGGYAQIAQGPLVSAAPGSTHRIEVWAVGTTLQGWWDGNVVVQTTTSAYQSATRHGLDWYAPLDAQTRFDNVQMRAASWIPQPPVVSGPSNQTHLATLPIAAVSIAATDPEGAPLTYGATGLPPGLTVNATTGAITGTPTTAGSYSVTATANDGLLTASRNFSWVVQPAATVSLASNAPAPRPIGSTINFTATGAAGISPLSYQFLTSSNGGATWTVAQAWSTTATFAWTPPTANGAYRVGVWVRSNGNSSSAEGTASVPYPITPAPPPNPAFGDTGGDGDADLSVWRASDGGWRTLSSDSGFAASSLTTLGGSSDQQPVAGDFDGDGRQDRAVWNGVSGQWQWHWSSSGATFTTIWGGQQYGDIPVPADYDGDGRVDIAFFRQPEGIWYILPSGIAYSQTLHITLGQPGDRPAPADYDGDGKADAAIWRPSTGLWQWKRSSNSQTQSMTLGAASAGETPVPADYDGDSKVDPAVWRGPTGQWRVLESTTNHATLWERAHGDSDVGQRAAPLDVDGDQKADLVVWGATAGANAGWSIARASASYAVTAISVDPGWLADAPISLAPPAITMAPCTYAVSPNPLNTVKEGGEAVFSVTTQPGCPWQAEPQEAFLTVVSPDTGSGSGQVRYGYAENVALGARSATLTIAGIDVLFTQAGTASGGGACTYAITPPYQSIGAGGGAVSFSVGTQAGCPWAAPDTIGFLSRTSAPTGTGNATVTYAAPANAGAERQATLQVAGQTIRVTQAASGSSPACTSAATVSPGNAQVGAGATTVYFQVVTGEGCAWSAADGWYLTVAETSGGVGSGWVGYAVPANPDTAARTATVVVAGVSVYVTQAAAQPGPPPNPGPGPYGMRISYYMNYTLSSHNELLDVQMSIWDDSWGCEHLNPVDEFTITGPNGVWNFDGSLSIPNAGGDYAFSANLSFFCMCLAERIGGSYIWVVPTPPPTPESTATVTLSPSSVTKPQHSGDVLITATVTPPEQAGTLSLSGTRGSRVGSNQWRVPTDVVGPVTVMASVGSGTQATATVVVEARTANNPVVILDPPGLVVVTQNSGFVDITATVEPSELAGTLEWDENNLGVAVGEYGQVWRVPTATVGTFPITARISGAEPATTTVQVQLPPPPQLRLFLEVADEGGSFSFNPADPMGTDAAASFVPGSYRTGTPQSPVSVSVMPSVIQQGQLLRVKAAFVDPGNPNVIVPPPAGVTAVSFSLPEYTAWRGYAMNQGDSNDPDFALESTSASFSGNVATVVLRGRDYGGRVVVQAQAAGQQANLQLPRDANNNWLPDAGWRAYATGQFASFGQSAEPVATDAFGPTQTFQVDSDTGTQWPATLPGSVGGAEGDGLTVFEEYRGFIVGGTHTRLSPARKDLFVSSALESTQLGLTRENSVQFAAAALIERGLRVHLLFDRTEASGAQAEYFVNYAGPDTQPDPMAADFECPNPLLDTDYNMLPGRQCLRLINDRAQNTGVGPSPPAPSTWPRAQGSLRLTPRAGIGPNTGPNYTFGVTFGACVNGGTVPSDAWWMHVDVKRHEDRGDAVSPPMLGTLVANEVRRTVGHEIGHGIDVLHRGAPNGCTDGVDPQGGTSLMNSEWFNGNGIGSSSSKFNERDVRQMRLHKNP